MSWICCRKKKQEGMEQAVLERKRKSVTDKCAKLSLKARLSNRDENTLQLYSQLKQYPNELSAETYGVALPGPAGENRKYTAMDFFNFHDVIGSGMTCVVFRAFFKLDNTFKAVKYIPDFKQHGMYAIQEIGILKYCRHCPYTANYHSHFRVGAHLYTVTELYEGGDLSNIIKPTLTLPPELARIYLKDIASALFFLHRAKIAHRDINTNNIVIAKDGHVRLIDFSCARTLKSGNTERFTDLGNAAYKAPEVYLDKHCTLAVDWWAVGILQYRFLCGQTPFCSTVSSTKLTASYQAVTKLAPKYPNWAFKDPTTLDFCQGLLQKNPHRRLGHSHEEKTVRLHPYFQSLDWQEKEDVLAIIYDDAVYNKYPAVCNNLIDKLAPSLESARCSSLFRPWLETAPNPRERRDCCKNPRK